jgi:hypothetical protein
VQVVRRLADAPGAAWPPEALQVSQLWHGLDEDCQSERTVGMLGLRGYGHHRPKLYTGPILPKTYGQAVAWLKQRPRLRIGFTTTLERATPEVIQVKEHGDVVLAIDKARA